MLKICPDPVDVQDIHFKLHCSLKVFSNSELATFNSNCSLVSCASRYGLLFIGSNTPLLKVIQLKTIENYNPNDKDVSNFPRRNLNLPSSPKHVCVNCDSTLLAIVLEKDNGPTVIFYDVLSFYKQNINVIKEVRLSASPGVYAIEVNWNPALPNIFTACKSDGSLGIYEIKGSSVDINELPQAAESTSFCWSPKGKQIAVGSKNGKITQYKPDLKAVKVINGPIFEKPHSLISLCWVSNYQFIGIYQDVQECQAKLVVIDAPKAGETSYTNYDDVCYSGSSRTPQFYLILLQHWNMLMIASSNSMELGLLGAVSELWTQWNVPDFARAELPLGADKQETLPVGMALDVGNTRPLPWGEGTIPPCPYLMLLSHYGILYFFNIVNLKEGAPSICCPPDNITDLSGIGEFVVEKTTISSLPQQTTSTPFSPQPQLPFQTPQPILPSQTPQPAFSFAKPDLKQSLPSFGAPVPSLVDSKPLFGPQVTLTPIKPQPEVSNPLFEKSAISLTPVSKPVSSTDNNEKYGSIFAALKAPSAVPIPEIKPIVVNPPETPKSGVPDGPRSIIDPKSVVDEKVKSETDALLAKMVKDECVALESELKALLHQGKRIKINIGTEEEKNQMVENLTNLQDFIKEIVDICLGESAEIHSLKQNLILSWSWYEEALSRYNASKDETMSLILQSQPLDSAAEKRQTDIRKIVYYLESQLYQASKALDEQWDRFQDYAKKTYKIQMPTMEAIFQSMVQQNAVLQKQSYILKDINSRLKHKKVSSNNPSLFLSLNNFEKLEEDLSRLQLNSDEGHRVYYEQSLDRLKKLSSSKRNKLRDMLSLREVSHVTVAKPQLNNTVSLLRSPTTRSKHIFSILGAQMSPVAKPSAAKNLQFSESTPVKFAQDIKPTAVPPNTPAQLDTSKSFAFKDIEKNNTFISISKSPLLSSSSAFVPTTPTSKTVLVPQQNFSKDPLPLSVPSTKTNSSQISFGSSISITPIAGKKPESVPKVTSKATFSFVSTGNVLPPKTEPSKPLFSTSNLPLFGADTSQSLFSFGKTSVTTPSSVVSTPQTFSFAKTTSIISPADSTVKPTNIKASTTTISSTKQTLSTISSTSVTNSALSVSKPINFGSSPSSKTFDKIALPTPSTTGFGFSFEATPTTSSLFSSAVTTTTTSLFGSITTPSVTSSIFATNPTLSTDSTTAVKSTSSFATVSTTAKSITPILSTSTSLFTTTASSSFSPVSVSTPSIFGTSASPVSSTKSICSSDSSTTAAFVVSTFSTPLATTAQSIFSTPTATTVQPTFSTPIATTAQSVFSSTSSKMSGSIFAPSETPTSSTSIKPKVDSGSVTQPSIFGTPTEETKSSVFSGTAISSTSSIFGGGISTSTQSSTFNSPTVAGQTSVFSTPTSILSTQSSIFGSNTTSTQSSVLNTTQSSIFESNTTSTQPSKLSTTQPSIFGSSTTNSQPSVLSTTQPSIFGSNTTSSQPSVLSTTQPSIFGSSTTNSQPSVLSTTQPSIFGSNTTSSQPSVLSTTQPSIFGSNTTTTASTSVFSNPNTFGIVSTPTPPFGSTEITTQASVFGTHTTSTPSVFGATTTATTQSSLFASPTTSPGGSIFGGTSVFGAASTQASIFGSAVPSTNSNSIFGGANTTTTFGTGFDQSNSIFGAAKTTASTFGSPSTFGTAPTTFGGNAGSIFGAPTTSSNVFGSGGSAFGAVSSSGNTFGSGGSSSFSFASAANSGGSMGFGDLNVGNNPASGGSIFGGSPSFGQPPANPFARASDQKSPFGSSFGTPTSTTSSIFASNTGSIFGGNAQNSFGSSSFGTPSSFGQQPAFGQGGTFSGNQFGTTQPGPFSGGGMGVGQTGFGSPTSFDKATPGFGGAPVFGGSPQPAFGTSPTFGGSPGFGGAPTFGSPPKVFEAATPSSTFGQSTGNAGAGFGNLATQNTVGFGSLAQQAATSTSTPFSGSSSFSSWR